MIDFQGDFCDDEHSYLGALGAPAHLPKAACQPASAVLAAARTAGLLILHTLEAHLTDLSDLPTSKDRRARQSPDGPPVIGQEGGHGRMLTRGSPCNGLLAAVAMRDGEVAIHKPGKGAFYHTELEARLQAASVTTLLVCGVTTECCVQSTMREANDRGYDLLVVTDATASCVPEFKTSTLEQLTAFGAIVGCQAESGDVLDALERLAATRPSTSSSTTTIPPTVDDAHSLLPVIDVSPLVQRLATPFDRDAVNIDCLRVAQQMDAACRAVGFFYVTGHGLTPPLASARAFFALAAASKHALTAGPGEGAGYEPSGAQVLDEGRLGDGIDGDPVRGDRKESYIIGKTAPSQRIAGNDDRIEGQWPDEAANASLVGFRETLLAYHDAAELFLRTLMRGAALGLGLAADTFDCFTKDAMTKVRLLRYPALTQDTEGYAQAFGCGTHTDWGALTLLAQDQVGGLEVFREHDTTDAADRTASGQWLPAPNIAGALLVNVGDMLKLWTGGRYRSAPHRVVKPGVDTQERHSIAVFFNCDYDAPIDPRLLMPNQTMEQDSDTVFTAEEYILERVKGTYA
jgi:isopenicillin N synthase-like dioxygenase/nicotinamidase-related amidase